MLSKTKKAERIDAEQREQYDYARRRIRQKKNLLRHFIFFLAGSILFIILSAALEIGNAEMGPQWFVWAILIWLFFLLIHTFNVFVLNTFMGKEWEDRQLEKLKNKQTERIAKLQKQVETEYKNPPPMPDKPVRSNRPDKIEETPNDL